MTCTADPPRHLGPARRRGPRPSTRPPSTPTSRLRRLPRLRADAEALAPRRRLAPAPRHARSHARRSSPPSAPNAAAPMPTRHRASRCAGSCVVHRAGADRGRAAGAGPRVRRRPAGAHRPPPRLVRRRARRRVPLRGVEARRASPGSCRWSPRWSRASSARRCSTWSPATPARSARRTTSPTSPGSSWSGCSAGRRAPRGDAAAGSRDARTPPRARGALVVALIVAVLAAPASAHATLLTTDPQPGGVYDTSPPRGLAAVQRAGRGRRSAASACTTRVTATASTSAEPEHPNGERRPRCRRRCRTSTTAPTSSRGGSRRPTRTRSQGAFTFQVGAEATLGQERGRRSPSVSCASQGGSTHRRRGLRDRPGRALRHARAAHRRRRCSSSAVFPAGRDSSARPADRVGRAGSRVVVTTVLGIALEGVYAVGAAARRSLRPAPCSATCSTPGTGRVALVRLALLVLALAVAPDPAARAARPRSTRCGLWWLASAGGARRRPLASRPGSRATRHRHPHRASPSPPTRPRAGDGVLARRPGDARSRSCCRAATSDELRQVLQRGTPRSRSARSSRSSSPAAFQAWRQVGSLDALQRHRLRPAADREARRVRGADRRRRVQPRGREPALPRCRPTTSRPTARSRARRRSGVPAPVVVPVGVGGRGSDADRPAGELDALDAGGQRSSGGNGYVDDDDDEWDEDDDETEVARLRRSVASRW